MPSSWELLPQSPFLPVPKGQQHKCRRLSLTNLAKSFCQWERMSVPTQWMISKKDSTKGISYNWVNIPAALRDQHAQPFVHTTGKAQIPGLQHTQGQGLTRAGQDCKCSTITKAQAGRREPLPWQMPHTTNAYNSMAEDVLWLGSWSCRGSRETSRWAWLVGCTGRLQPSQPSLPR